MKEKRFTKIKEKSIQELLAIIKSTFQKSFEDCKKRWHKCIISKGVELDKICIEK